MSRKHKIFGVTISRTECASARKLLTTFHNRRITQAILADHDANVARVVRYIRAEIDGFVGLRIIIEWVAKLRDVPMCACGRNVVTRWSANSPQKCDDGWDCPRMIEVRTQRTRQTCRRRYGTDNVAQDPEIKKRIAATNLQRYGVENPLKNRDVQEQIRKTNGLKYGGQPANDPRVRDKMRRTNEVRYGGVAPACDPRIQAKIEATNLERRGVRSCFQCPKALEKAMITNLERYGTKCPCQSAEIKARIVQGFIEKYGATNVFGSEVGKRLVREGMLRKYGVEHALQHPDILRQQQMSGFRYKVVPLGDRLVMVQGYEETALRYLLWRGIKPTRIHVSMDGDVPRIPYTRGLKKHKYFPDILVDDDHVIEVKSTWYLAGSREQLNRNKAKALATMRKGYRFTMIVVFDGRCKKRHVIVLPSAWLTMKRHQLVAFMREKIKNRRGVVDRRLIPKR